jgi:toll-interacting protein
MATSSMLIDESADVYPKGGQASAVAASCSISSSLNESSSNTIESLRSKAFVPAALPQDFLRIVLDQRQLGEHKDRMIAHQMQFGMQPSLAAPGINGDQYQQHRSRHEMEAATSRGRLQINIVEAKLNKNYGLTRMDPYVRIRIGNKIFETPTAYNGSKNPVWKKSVFWYVMIEI